MTLLDQEREWRTRQERVDPRLKAAGWKPARLDGRPLAQRDREAVKEYPTENGPADYALCQEGQIDGVVEAKKITLGPQEVLTQSQRYSRGATDNPMNFNGYRVPFLYSTNGEVIWFQDVRHAMNRSRRIAAFHTPEALAQMLNRDFDADCERLRQLANDHPRLRPYQLEANAAIEEAIAERKRQNAGVGESG